MIYLVDPDGKMISCSDNEALIKAIFPYSFFALNFDNRNN